ncbi:AAA family ATPase [Devosia submarina]|uniref:AAA family ATPase n=1 Tax=Devosia submarina TaxID=1173082 RepID=UPI000D34BFB9|nr:AAA family ATPase [Devosia submarina]
MQIPALENLGPRIWITGPAAGGKSTLACALGQKLELPTIHLDQIRFEPGTWAERAADAFLADVEALVSQDAWIIEGNYFSFLGGRLERATGVISLSSPRLGNFRRYLWRCMRPAHRMGTMQGAGETPNWTMIRWILWDEPKRRTLKRETLSKARGLLVATNSFADLHRLYTAWNLGEVT